MTIEITNDDYNDDTDWDLAYGAGAHLMLVITDISFHHCAPGDGWDPHAKDVAGLVEEVKGHLVRVEAATKEARAELARVERTARLRAARRERSG